MAYTQEYMDKLILQAFKHFEELRIETHGDMCSLRTDPLGHEGKYIGCPFGIGLYDCSECIVVEAQKRFGKLLQTENRAKLERYKYVKGHCRDCKHFTPNIKPSNGGRTCYKDTCKVNLRRNNTVPSAQACRYFERRIDIDSEDI